MFMGLWSIAVVCVSVMKSVLMRSQKFLETEAVAVTMVLYSLSHSFSTSASWWIFLHWMEMFYNVPSITVAASHR